MTHKDKGQTSFRSLRALKQRLQPKPQFTPPKSTGTDVLVESAKTAKRAATYRKLPFSRLEDACATLGTSVASFVTSHGYINGGNVGKWASDGYAPETIVLLAEEKVLTAALKNSQGGMTAYFVQAPQDIIALLRQAPDVIIVPVMKT